MYKKDLKYFSKHVMFNSAIHIVGGIGIGILIASPIIGPHPVRWGVTFIVLSVLGHVYAVWSK